MRISMCGEISPFIVPTKRAVVIKDAVIDVPLSEIKRDTLLQMCNEFERNVLKAAGYEAREEPRK